MRNLVHTDQPYEVALLIGYKQDCDYCGINFVDKPIQVCFDRSPISGLRVNIIWDKLINNSYGKTYFAVVGPSLGGPTLQTIILKTDGMTCTADVWDEVEYKYHCKEVIPRNTKLISRVEAAYRRKFLSGHELYKPLCSCDKLPELTIVPNGRNWDAGVVAKLKKEFLSIADGSLKLKGLGDNIMIKNVPVITRCIINDPAVVVFWSDDTKTVGKCMGGDEFNPEIGLAMAISRKYYELIGFPNPRSAFRNQLKKAQDRSAKTKEKRERKKTLHDVAKAED